MVGFLYVQVVHKLKAIHCSQRDLLTLVWFEYDGKKLSPFEIYRCHKGTTEEDLSLFFCRMQQFKYARSSFLSLCSAVHWETPTAKYVYVYYSVAVLCTLC